MSNSVMQLMNGKAGLVTGGGSGIGRAGAIAFSNNGGKVIVSDSNEDSGQDTATQIKELGGQAEFFKCDASDEGQVRALVQFTLDTYGTLDYAFNNAGISGNFMPIGDADSAVFDRVMKINVYGVFYCMKHEVLAMEKHGGGAIVNTASGAGLIGIGHNAPYTASKFGVVGMTRSVAIDYASKGIRVNALAPGSTATPMLTRSFEEQPPEVKERELASIPMGALSEPEDQANAAVWLCSDQARMITGVTLAVDGGWVAGK